eukprot:6991035-Pyramimonas_sp.AAC.1
MRQMAADMVAKLSMGEIAEGEVRMRGAGVPALVRLKCVAAGCAPLYTATNERASAGEFSASD